MVLRSRPYGMVPNIAQDDSRDPEPVAPLPLIARFIRNENQFQLMRVHYVITSNFHNALKNTALAKNLWDIRSVLALLIIVWFVAYMLFSQLIHLNFDPARERWRVGRRTGELHAWETSTNTGKPHSPPWRLCLFPLPTHCADPPGQRWYCKLAVSDMDSPHHTGN
ncbi:hypothetical protein IWQ61_004237 [Dispira simplex]|nr:hypothetical protein IWQ61_004237 [Dispira simplex]